MTLGFYLPRSSGLHLLHPLTKLVLVGVVLLVGLSARQPVVPPLLVAGIILPLAIWGQIAGRLIRDATAVALPFIISLGLVQSVFFPGAAHVLFTLGPVSIKEEGLLFSFVTVGRILLIASSGLLVLLSTPPADLMLALVQRGMPASIAYALLSAIQLLPEMVARGRGIADAQRARGLELEGSLWTRTQNLVPMLGPLISSALADVDERAMALEARSFFSKQMKTSYRELRDTRLQVRLRLGLLVIGLLTAGLEVWAR